MRSGLVECDSCRKPIAIAGAKTAKIMVSEYTVEYFSCPHCGYPYVFRTTDDKQRKLQSEHEKIQQKRRIGIAKHYRKKTLDAYEKERKKVYAQMKERSRFLMEIGRALLKGQELEDILREVEAHDEAAGCGTDSENIPDGESRHTEEATDSASAGTDERTTDAFGTTT